MDLVQYEETGRGASREIYILRALSMLRAIGQLAPIGERLPHGEFRCREGEKRKIMGSTNELLSTASCGRSIGHEATSH